MRGLGLSPHCYGYVADCGNNRIQIFSLSGSYLGELGTPQTNPLQYYDTAKAEGSMLLPYGIARCVRYISQMYENVRFLRQLTGDLGDDV